MLRCLPAMFMFRREQVAALCERAVYRHLVPPFLPSCVCRAISRLMLETPQTGAGRGCLSRGGCDECVRSGHARVVGLVSRRRPRGARSVWAASRGSGCKGCAG
eukprot:1884294-Rhodomonas_salina.5